MTRAILIALIVVAVLTGVYAAAGYLAAPSWLREAIGGRLQERGLAFSAGGIRTDPFLLTAELEQVRVSADGAPLLAARLVSVDLTWASLWRRAWTVEHAVVREPRVLMHVGSDGTLNWRAVTQAGQQEPAAPPPVFVDSFVLEQGRLQFVRETGKGSTEARLHGIGARVTDLSLRGATAASYTASGQFAAGGALATQGSFNPRSRVVRGRLVVEALPLPRVWSLAGSDAPAAAGRIDARARYTLAGGEFALHEVAIEGSGIVYSDIELSRVTLDAARVPVPAQQPFAVSAHAELAQQGELAAAGTVTLAPPGATLQAEATSVALQQIRPWLPADFAVRIVSGVVSGAGRLDVAAGDDGWGVDYDGSLTVADLRLEEGDSGSLLLAWQHATTPKLAFSHAGPALAVGDVEVQAPEGHLVIEPDGSVNFAEAFGAGGGSDGQRGTTVTATFARIAIDGGVLHLDDRSLSNPFSVTIRQLGGSIVGFTVGEGEPARVALKGRVGERGSAYITGMLDLDAPRTLADITARLSNLGLTAFNPYITKFAGYRIRSGRVSATLDYELRDGRLQGSNDLVFRQMRLGEKVAGAGGPDLPLDLAVALLTDAQGRINLDIPVSGNLNDPEFDFGGIVAHALGNAVQRIVSAPFRALGRLLGGGDDEAPGEIRFERGRSAVKVEADESLARVAEALQQRPGLHVAIHGGYDPDADAAAMREWGLRRELARLAGRPTAGPGAPELDLNDWRVIRAAETLLVRRGGSLLQLADHAGEPGYGDMLYERLAAMPPARPADAAALATRRAERVRETLIAHGIDPERITIGAQAGVTGNAAGVPTTLALSAAADGSGVSP